MTSCWFHRNAWRSDHLDFHYILSWWGVSSENESSHLHSFLSTHSALFLCAAFIKFSSITITRSLLRPRWKAGYRCSLRKRWNLGWDAKKLWNLYRFDRISYNLKANPQHSILWSPRAYSSVLRWFPIITPFLFLLKPQTIVFYRNSISDRSIFSWWFRI
jgi:hypothetical protein